MEELKKAARLAARANGYNLYELVECLIDWYSPESYVHTLNLIHNTLVDYILRDKDFQGGECELSNTVYFLRQLSEAIGTMMVPKDERNIKLIVVEDIA